MAACFTEWTVLPHDKIVKHSDRLWTVIGTMPNGKTKRTMTMAKMADERVVIHNAIALDDDEMLDLESWGTPSVLLVPNGYHRQDAKIWKERFRESKVYCPATATDRVEQVVKVDGTYEDAPSDDAVTIALVPGTKKREGMITVRDDTGTTVVFCDLLCNFPPLKGFMGFLLGPTGALSVPRAARLLTLSDKEVFRKELQTLAAQEDLVRIVPGHGRIITENTRGVLKRAITTF